VAPSAQIGIPAQFACPGFHAGLFDVFSFSRSVARFTGSKKGFELSEGSQRFVGQSVLVTGAARGLGLGAAERFVREGAHVWLADIDPIVEEVARAIEAEAGVVCDVTDSGQIDALIASIVDQTGRLDVVLANAGIGGGGPLTEMTEEAVRHILATNLESVIYTCRAAARAMRPRRCGVIVTVGSVFGRDTPAGSAVYGAAKAGVVAITQSLARELAPHGIRVNCVSPGHMGTELYWRALQRRATATGRTYEEMVEAERVQIPLERFGTGEDMGGLVAFLASPDGAYITGQTINLDGGLQPR
jgi:NAD(P)-dependent dehydrogenase (short-subunit alcohol dehydrogenase family)